MVRHLRIHQQQKGGAIQTRAMNKRHLPTNSGEATNSSITVKKLPRRTPPAPLLTPPTPPHPPPPLPPLPPPQSPPLPQTITPPLHHLPTNSGETTNSSITVKKLPRHTPPSPLLTPPTPPHPPPPLPPLPPLQSPHYHKPLHHHYKLPPQHHHIKSSPLATFITHSTNTHSTNTHSTTIT